ncbi:MAG: hypothetical protein HY078_13335 [Elusimicrobia bacterium]|nr:hypothetical protein [Elusimicrobiota bacterium]
MTARGSFSSRAALRAYLRAGVTAATFLSVHARASAPSVELVMPAAPAATIKSARWKDVRFSVDGRGRPWLLHDKTGLLCPVEGAEFRLVFESDGMAFTGGVSPLLSSDGYLGSISASYMLQTDDSGRTRLPFRPARALPAAACRLHDGGTDAVYAVCAAKGAHELYVVPRGSGKPITRLLSSPEPIAAAAGDGTSHYAAVGGLVLKLAGGAKEPEALLKLDSPVRALAFDPAAGLFYATAGEAGRIAGGEATVLLKADRPLLRAHGGALYAFSEGDWSILKLSGF